MLRSLLFLMLVIFCKLISNAQDTLYTAPLLTKEFHIARRQALREKMPSNSVAVFFSATEKVRSNDVEYDFHQDPDFYYLTGLNEPGALLFVFKDEQHSSVLSGKECLFVQERNPSKETWTGRKAGIEGARKISGIANVILNTAFEPKTWDFSKMMVLVKTDQNELIHYRKNKPSQDLNPTFFSEIIDIQHLSINEVKLNTFMKELREIKKPEEILLIKKAINVTAAAQLEVCTFLKPGQYEYQAQAVLEYIFKEQGCEHPAFPSIVGGGENSCILHSTSNRKKLLSGDMVVVDIGAEFQGYAADVTRTYPIDGKFSEEEKVLYELVLQAQNGGIAACRKGNSFDAPHKAAKEVIASGLLKLGIIKEEKAYKTYFMHGTSHYLGLDVHDAGTYGPLEPGNLITVEPGIYIPAGSACDKKWWNIGIRIEDDVLITENGNEILSAGAPRSVDEIEKLMRTKSRFNQ